jgi:Zinc knuckle
MNRYQGISARGSSKATASTLCQKCLKRDKPNDPLERDSILIVILRHYSFECKAVAQERPYVSRPSRTQQLFNPKLVPKLTSDVPQDLLRKYVYISRGIFYELHFPFSLLFFSISSLPPPFPFSFSSKGFPYHPSTPLVIL